MTGFLAADQLAALRALVFNAVDSWNVAHPHHLRSHLERASLSVTQVYADSVGPPSFVLAVECTLIDRAPLTFHGADLANIAEHARLTLEHKIEVEMMRRSDTQHDGVAV